MEQHKNMQLNNSVYSLLYTEFFIQLNKIWISKRKSDFKTWIFKDRIAHKL